MQKILTIITQLTRFCLQSLHHRLVAWTKPNTTSLLLGMLIDLSRSKSELVAENALLRKPLIILRRQVKRPCTGYFGHPFRKLAFLERYPLPPPLANEGKGG